MVHGALKALTGFVLELQESAHALRGRMPLQAVFSQQQVLTQACEPAFQGRAHALVDG